MRWFTYKALGNFNHRLSRGTRQIDKWQSSCRDPPSSSHYELDNSGQDIFDALKDCSWIDMKMELL